MEDRERFEQPAIANRRYTFFTNIDTAFDRGEVLLKMVRDFSSCGLREVLNTSLDGLTNSNELAVMDVYDRTFVEAIEIIRHRQQNIKVGKNPVRIDKPCSPENLRQMLWKIPAGSAVELLVDNRSDRVVGIRKWQQGNDSIG
jgi:hypothetical protein